jgi:hypothetical protein
MLPSALLALFLAAAAPSTDGAVPLLVEPSSIALRGAEARQQLLVTALRDGRPTDVTDAAEFVSSQPTIAAVGKDGVVLPVGDGTATITAIYGDQRATVQVTVAQAVEQRPLHFGNDIIPLLTKAGCNSGGCHGKQNGQAGFKLSVFGYDVDADYRALVFEGRGRRVSPTAPDASLLLAKATNRTPHGGGLRIDEDSAAYRQLRRWIASGLPHGDALAPRVVAIDVVPKQRILSEQSRQRLLVTARYSDGSLRDVTHEAVYTANDETLAAVDREGRIATTKLSGESAVVVRYQDQVAAAFITVPLNAQVRDAAGLAAWDRSHFIDRLVAEKWERLQLSPSPPADDATFHRRAFLDLIGKLPTPAETKAFLADASPDKRTRLIDALLDRPEYAEFWALKWSDLLRVNREDLGAKAAYRYHQWLLRSLRENKPYNEFLRELVTAQGSGEQNGAVHFFSAFATPNDLTVALSQVFLGVRLDCAKCHHHPYEKWSQEDFYGLAAFFPRLQKKKALKTEEFFFIADKGDVKHPQTKETVNPRVLLGEAFDPAAEFDPRARLGDWLASPDNPFVARSLVNRVWAQLMGRGLVEPVDDMRETNPPTNGPLLDALAREFVEHGYDVRRLIRTIAVSNVYGLASQPNADNLRDLQNYSRAYRKRLSAEVLLDAVNDVTGEAESFAGMPPGTRAVQLWDHRLPSAFLDTFGRPQRKTVCQCERAADVTLGQVLHLMNAAPMNDKISAPTGRVAQLVAAGLEPPAIVTELYLATYGRPPRADEATTALSAFDAPGIERQTAAEDILWALLNSAEFVFNH